jgi:hypothetical protein
MGRHRPDYLAEEEEQVLGCCKHGVEPFGFIIFWESVN